ncbi:hypothetical protein A4R35_03490 [Thermogemmatispora tikiterensis]|uniref:Uncharacterized protein n=1 Tax=Thermogemmatispora tikiterensis TaxID=1825093 RepID=A0A328VG60_9CHLR|nr:hypothetical protein A4R35_03490 [Thermogemmatispora tikiterensis]
MTVEVNDLLHTESPARTEPGGDFGAHGNQSVGGDLDVAPLEDPPLHAITQDLLNQALVVVAQSNDVVTVGSFQGSNLGIDDEEFVLEAGVETDVVSDGLP